MRINTPVSVGCMTPSSRMPSASGWSPVISMSLSSGIRSRCQISGLKPLGSAALVVRASEEERRPFASHDELRGPAAATNRRPAELGQIDDDRFRDAVVAAREFDQPLTVGQGVLDGSGVVRLAVASRSVIANIAHREVPFVVEERHSIGRFDWFNSQRPHDRHESHVRQNRARRQSPADSARIPPAESAVAGRLGSMFRQAVFGKLVRFRHDRQSQFDTFF